MNAHLEVKLFDRFIGTKLMIEEPQGGHVDPESTKKGQEMARALEAYKQEKYDKCPKRGYLAGLKYIFYGKQE